MGDVTYEVIEVSYNAKVGLIKEPWRETDGNVERRGYIQIDNTTGENKMRMWENQDILMNSHCLTIYSN